MELFKNVDEMWLNALSDLTNSDIQHEVQSSRDGDVAGETLGYSGRLLFPELSFLHSPTRNLSPYYAMGEMIWYLSGTDDPTAIIAYAPQYKRFCDVTNLGEMYAHGAYGARWRSLGQLRELIILLRGQPNTRQAILSMWKSSDLFFSARKERRDIPCTLSLQFIIRDDLLNCICTMRSNDVWLGMPYDIYCFTTLQHIIASVLQVNVGWYQHDVGSLHLYDRNYEKACIAVEKEAISEEVLRIQYPVHRFPDLNHENWLDQIGLFVHVEQDLRKGFPRTAWFNPSTWYHDAQWTVARKFGAECGNVLPSLGWKKRVEEFD